MAFSKLGLALFPSDIPKFRKNQGQSRIFRRVGGNDISERSFSSLAILFIERLCGSLAPYNVLSFACTKGTEPQYISVVVCDLLMHHGPNKDLPQSTVRPEGFEPSTLGLTYQLLLSQPSYGVMFVVWTFSSSYC